MVSTKSLFHHSPIPCSNDALVHLGHIQQQRSNKKRNIQGRLRTFNISIRPLAIFSSSILQICFFVFTKNIVGKRSGKYEWVKYVEKQTNKKEYEINHKIKNVTRCFRLVFQKSVSDKQHIFFSIFLSFFLFPFLYIEHTDLRGFNLGALNPLPNILEGLNLFCFCYDWLI